MPISTLPLFAEAKETFRQDVITRRFCFPIGSGRLKHERIKKAKGGGDKISLTNHSGWVRSNRNSKARVVLYPWHGGKKVSWSFRIFMGMVTGTHGHHSWNFHHPALRLSQNLPHFVLA